MIGLETAAAGRHHGRRVFVIGPYTPNGGTYMAYRVGRIFQQDFGFEAIAVSVGEETPDHGVFSYDPVFPMMSVDAMERAITPKDVLFANLGHSRFLFGPRIPGRKLMYAQGFTNARPLDCSFDAYVSVSRFVAAFLERVYAISSPVIPAFVDASVFARGIPWLQRPPGSLVVHAKGHPAELDVLRRALAIRDASIVLEPVLPGGLPQSELARRLAGVRYVVTVATAEGFGLIPLEGMAAGAVVVGFDGFGGREYMLDGVNCLCTSYADYGGLADRIVAAVSTRRAPAALLEAASATSRRYGYEQFRRAWTDRIQQFLLPAS